VAQETFSSSVEGRCIYVLVWDLTNAYSQKRIEHWCGNSSSDLLLSLPAIIMMPMALCSLLSLKRLYSISNHTKKAPILLVGTHRDDPRLISERHLDQLRERLAVKFNRAFRNIQSTFFVDSLSGFVRHPVLPILYCSRWMGASL